MHVLKRKVLFQKISSHITFYMTETVVDVANLHELLQRLNAIYNGFCAESAFVAMQLKLSSVSASFDLVLRESCVTVVNIRYAEHVDSVVTRIGQVANIKTRSLGRGVGRLITVNPDITWENESKMWMMSDHDLVIHHTARDQVAVWSALFRFFEDEMTFPASVFMWTSGVHIATKGNFWMQRKEFDVLNGGGLAWSAVSPLLAGVVSAHRFKRHCTSTSDPITCLLLDPRLVRMRDGLVSSYMTGLLVSFLPPVETFK
jgi:hypothetical protein